MFDVNDLEQIRKHGRSITKGSIANMLHTLIIKTGQRQINHQFSGRERVQVPLAHGFRKFWTTQVINSKVNPEIRELLLGHKIGLMSSYYRPTKQEMIDEYIKAFDNLTINEENRLKKKVDELQVKYDKIDALVSRIDQLEKQLS
jgi:integrase